MATLVAAVMLGAAAAAAPCSTALDCSLNGDCSKGVCVCDAPWAGASCGLLRRGPAKPGGAYGNFDIIFDRFSRISRALLSSMPPNTHRMVCSTSCLC